VANKGREDIIMSIENNTFCWHGISTDVEMGKAFYPSVLGWTLVDSDDGIMFVAPGGAVSHIQPADQGPPAWCSFLAVADLDASTKLAAEEGTILVPPTALASGRFSVVSTPSGAVFGLYEATDADVLATPGPGSIHWVELQRTEVESDLAWLAKVSGLSHRTEQMAAGPYNILEAGGAPRGGVMASPSGRSAFVTYVQVEDLDATLGKVGQSGGHIVMDAFSDPAVGRMALVSDPSGATFGLIQPA
jgi:predicted enzyme related to lactoylglutathione lyase